MNVPGSGQADILLRQSRAYHAQLSAMADMKASMLITMASIILTLTASRVTQIVSPWPFRVLMASCFVTILLAAYAVMPKMPFRKGPPSAALRASPRFNVLFFGDYSGMSYAEFEAQMTPLLNDPSAGYEAQVREIYLLGVYLTENKYRFLRLAYLSFMAGLATSLILVLLDMTRS